MWQDQVAQFLMQLHLISAFWQDIWQACRKFPYHESTVFVILNINTNVYDKVKSLCQVHGGTTKENIVEAVEEAEERAQNLRVANEDTAHQIEVRKKEGPIGFGTVLFFDEANTTQSINMIKEIMCDRTVNGRQIDHDLRIIAACNPYKR